MNATIFDLLSNYVQYQVTIIPSQMEVAPPHRTVDIRQKRRLFKNTKETEKILEG